MTRFTNLISLAALICGVSFLPVHATQAQTTEALAEAQMNCASIAAEVATHKAQADSAKRHAAFGFARSMFSAAAPGLLGQIGGGSMFGQAAAQAAMGVAQQSAMQSAMNGEAMAGYGAEDRGARLREMAAARGCTAG